jgi:hypothetical protein
MIGVTFIAAAMVAAVGGLSCGQTSEANIVVAGEMDASSSVPKEGGETRNACGGRRELTLLRVARMPGDSCGVCGDGVVVCGSPEVLVCAGGRPGACGDGSTDGGIGNLCGGVGELSYEGIAAQPGDPCGRCGVLICASPALLTCVPAASEAECGDGGSDAGVENRCGGKASLTLAGKEAAPGDPCGACGDGVAICGAPNLLVCTGAQESSTCAEAGTEAGTTNACGGREVLLLPDGGAALLGSSCGPCGDGTVICASPNLLVCSGGGKAGACDGPTPPNECGGVGDLRYMGVPAQVGDSCGPCKSGALACSSMTTLWCPGEVPADYCSDSSTVINGCGGTGPLFWDGALSYPSASCGPCKKGSLKCVSTSGLACGFPTSLSCDDAGAAPTCEIPLSAYSQPAPPAPSDPPETAPADTTVSTVSMATNAIVYNPFDRRLYASVASSQGAQGGNSVAVVDPVAASVVKSIFVGSEPGKMALSDDGQVLWVALKGARAVRRVDLLSQTAGPQFDCAGDISDVAVLAHTHDSVLVARGNGIVLYDNGVPRPYGVVWYSDRLTNVIPTNSAQLAYGYDGATTGFELVPICINDRGLFPKQDIQVFTDFNETFAGAGGIIYGSDGKAYDIAQNKLIGTFDDSGSVAADASIRRVFFLKSANYLGAAVVSSYDMDTFLPAGSETHGSVTGSFSNLVRWGRYGFAFLASKNAFGGEATLVVSRSKLVPPH